MKLGLLPYCCIIAPAKIYSSKSYVNRRITKDKAMSKKQRYDLPNVKINYSVDRQRQEYHLRDIQDFLHFALDIYDLSVRDYLPQMGHDPFFLVAATGLGKTVAVPIHVYLKQLELFFKGVDGKVKTSQKPTLYVVEPRIPIAEDQMYHMNSLFAKFIKQKYGKRAPRNPVLFGCVTSATSTIHREAPIKFVTTGLLGIYAESGELKPINDCIVIDEAHVTIEQNADVELAIGICRQLGVTIHYMSATVDTSNVSELLGVNNIIMANKQRYPIWLHNLEKSMDEVIVDLVDKILVQHDTKSRYFPPSGYRQQSQILRGVNPQGRRASGMLIVVNSFQSENSDVNRFAHKLEKAHFNKPNRQVKILRLASETIRNRSKKAAFDRQMDIIHRNNELYVIIATSVVEMGITFATLDYVVTMDSGFDNEVIEGILLPRMTSLGVNALKQRVGRVGRKRPGIGYISREIGAEYTYLSDRDLNTGGLEYEPIRPPYLKAPLSKLAALSFKSGATDVRRWLASLRLPSKPEQNRLEEFMSERDKLVSLGVANEKGLTSFGRYCSQWIGITDSIEYAAHLQRSVEENASYEIIFYYLVLVALSQHDFAELVQKYGQVEIDDNELFSIGSFSWNKSQLGDVEVSRSSDIVTLYNLMSYFSNNYSHLLYGNLTQYEIQFAVDMLRDEARTMGLDGLQVKRFLDAINNALKFFQKINRGRDELQQFIGSSSMTLLEGLTVPKIGFWKRFELSRSTRKFLSHDQIVITNISDQGHVEWQSTTSDKAGTFRTSQTGINLEVGMEITAKLLPSLKRGDDGISTSLEWTPIHMQVS